MEQVFFIADFHLGDQDVFTKDENGRRMNVNVAVRDNWLLDMWMSQVGKKDCQLCRMCMSFLWPRQKRLVCPYWLCTPDTATGSRKLGIIWNIVQKLIDMVTPAIEMKVEDVLDEWFGPEYSVSDAKA